MFGDLTLALWWRGPLLLLRRPGVALALAASALVATLPAAPGAWFTQVRIGRARPAEVLRDT